MKEKIQNHNNLLNKDILPFHHDVFIGLSKRNKAIPSKYLYNDIGSQLFNQITQHPDYYLTRCELEILTKYKAKISTYLDAPLIELGPGEGIKTRLLIEQFLNKKINFTYYPVDISRRFLKDLEKKLKCEMPSLKINPIHKDYLSELNYLTSQSKRINFILFLGSSIGNLSPLGTYKFLTELHANGNPGDIVLIGFDLRKDVDILMRAYDDSDGITKEFNYNLLNRINHELHANFETFSFIHYPIYNPNNGAMESYLLSRTEQTIQVGINEKRFHFDALEPIHIETSHKYSIAQIAKLANNCQFEVLENFFDVDHFFVNSLWRLN